MSPGHPEPNDGIDFEPTGTMTHNAFEVVEANPAGRGLTILIAVVVLGALGYLGLEYMQTGVNPFDRILDEMSELAGLGEGPLIAPKKVTGDGKEVATPDSDGVSPSGIADESYPENPYLELPNRAVGDDRFTLDREWSVEEEEQFRSGMIHEFVYQRYKTVQDVRSSRLSGSQQILWDALGERKFWTRMEALLGLAEFGQGIDREAVVNALGDARSELIANYFKRFSVKTSAGIRQVLREALPVVDGRARVEILRSLNVHRDELWNLYLIAATFDQEPRVQRLIAQVVNENPMPEDEYQHHRQVVLGQIETSQPEMAPTVAVDAAEAPGLPVVEDAEEIPVVSEPISEEEIEFGEIEFLDAEKGAGDDFDTVKAIDVGG